MASRSEKLDPVAGANQAGCWQRLRHAIRAWARRETLRRKLKCERRQLLEMSDRMLADIGIDRHEAEAEAYRNGFPAARLALLERDSQGSRRRP